MLISVWDHGIQSPATTLSGSLPRFGRLVDKQDPIHIRHLIGIFRFMDRHAIENVSLKTPVCKHTLIMYTDRPVAFPVST